jgi:hypothetical protein
MSIRDAFARGVGVKRSRYGGNYITGGATKQPMDIDQTGGGGE